MSRATNDLISKFIILPKAVNITNPKLLRLFETFKLNYDEFLPTKKPSFIDKNPFEFHSSYNGNQSYVNNPRLSVTKLLTESWCELRDYYEVYSGSVMEPSSEAQSLGSKYHEELEMESFEIISIGEFQKVLSEIFPVEQCEPGFRGIKDPGLAEIAFEPENMLAYDWAESIMFKLYSLMLNSETRELLVHDYLDLTHQKLGLSPDSVLISGIIDHLKLVNVKDPQDFSMFEEIKAFLDLKFDNGIVDLDALFLGLENILSSYNEIYKLQITDVKTRRFNKIPNQDSVLKSAYLQVSYYKEFFERLSQDSKYTYESLCTNAMIRHHDLDKPLHPIILFSLLRKYPELFLNDFKSIAKGSSIGHVPYSSEFKEFDGYDFTDILTPEILKSLEQIDDFNYKSILSTDILRKWERPLTLRYFAARSSQFFNLFKPFNSDLISIEYHNVRTKFNFKTIKYKFNKDDLENSVVSSSNFWNGTSSPRVVDDLSKCKYCDFNTKCSVPNQDMKYFGHKLSNFLNQG
ncbi:Mitochondrial 5'-3' exonuclease and sliding exonuclease [Yamadazyma tenuis]|uniref:Exonuclease V, mitochondrial n=1 Tax=Candida tenuis (strain ATCC 10573 / BCRC 21748 / CBS 615 / JCM 9827 / NBRC 10315 / NRRL Y-1498 / VKM Y-70) TaxID=590646 RepID=G3BEV7_CANTC|nr:uncharacterized protein CANTEDRAFT_111997 [Yamadazyma tenuis ATCC 10573]EGV60604.1 hypothetical protein CANTEDRAFT_111997 [Yamadazyma tenuis ATCC 10573]WEJ94147.1 Mitochondrial 5'-3' exonuclease and sliding exonuclease [Yamadazyma tenuis]